MANRNQVINSKKIDKLEILKLGLFSVLKVLVRDPFALSFEIFLKFVLSLPVVAFLLVREIIKQGKSVNKKSEGILIM